jgi:hypothetical protein
MKHTTGTWTAYKRIDPKGYAMYVIHYGVDGEFVAEVVHKEADARLIVSAPEMLAMLEELEWSGEGELTNGGRITFCPICERCFGVHTEDCKLGNLMAKVRGK